MSDIRNHHVVGGYRRLAPVHVRARRWALWRVRTAVRMAVRTAVREARTRLGAG